MIIIKKLLIIPLLLVLLLSFTACSEKKETEKVKLTTKELSPEKGCDTVTIMLILHNATTYDLTYSFIAENSGRLKTKADWFDCFTEADVIGFWKELKKR